MSGSKICWVDHGASDGYEIKVYEIDNMDSLQRRGKAGNKVICKKNHNVNISSCHLVDLSTFLFSCCVIVLLSVKVIMNSLYGHI